MDHYSSGWIVKLTIVLLILFGPKLLLGCPEECRCSNDITTNKNIFIVDCNNRRLRSFPALFDLGPESGTKTETDPKRSAGQKDYIKGEGLHKGSLGASEELINTQITPHYQHAGRPSGFLTTAGRGDSMDRSQPSTVHILANGNRFTYLLRNKLLVIGASRLAVLEMERNLHVMDIAPDVLDDVTLAARLEKLRLGPVRGDRVAGLLQRVYAFKQLKELAITGSVSALKERSDRTHSPIDSACELYPSALALSLQVLKLSKVGTLVTKGERPDDARLNLVDLTLSGLRITTVPAFATRSISSTLKYLDLSRNSLKGLWEVEKSRSTGSGSNCKLVRVDLSYNRIQSVEGGVLKHCLHLKFLDLSHNALISDVEPGLLWGLSAVTLDLSFTGVRSLEALSPTQVSEVRMFSAGLKCDCNLFAQSRRLGHGKVKGSCISSHIPNSKEQKSDMSLDDLIIECPGSEDILAEPFSLFTTAEDAENNGGGTGGEKQDIDIRLDTTMPVQQTASDDLLNPAIAGLDSHHDMQEGDIPSPTQDGVDNSNTESEPQKEYKDGFAVGKDQHKGEQFRRQTSPVSKILLMQWLFPLGYSVFVPVACVLHGLLLFAAFFTAGHGMRKEKT